MFHRTTVSQVLGALGVALILLGALLAPVSAAFSHSRTVLVDEEEFVATFAPLAADPGVRQEIVRLAMAEIDIPELAERALEGVEDVGPASLDLRSLELPAWLADSTELLEQWGVPAWLTDLLAPAEEQSAGTVDDLGERASQLVEDRVREVLSEVARSSAFSAIWRETLREAHGQVREQLSDPTRAMLTVNVLPIIGAARSALISEGMTFARFIPVTPHAEYSIELLPPTQVAQAAPTTALIIRFGAWASWIPLGLIAAGIVLAPQRRAWIVIGGALCAGAGAAARAALASGWAQAWLLEHVAADPIMAAATRAWAGAVSFAAVPTLTVITGLGLLASVMMVAVSPATTWAQLKQVAGFGAPGPHPPVRT